MRSIVAVALIVLLAHQQEAIATQELNTKTFKELTTSGQNGMIKFFQHWCGHCKSMKPAWDQLADEADSSVFIADVDCGQEDELCQENDVQGYPTIKVYKDGEVEDYQGPRDFDGLLQFVDENLAEKCDIAKVEETCSEKAVAYTKKWQAKDSGAVSKEIQRLTGMAGKSMTAELKRWLRERITILKQIGSSDKEL